MLDFVKATIRQIAVFMICAQAVTHFRPKDSYEKYLKLLLGGMILIQLFQPFCKLFVGGNGQQLSDSVERFRIELDNSMEEAARQSVIVEEWLEAMSLKEVQERLPEQNAMGIIQVEPIQIEIE